MHYEIDYDPSEIEMFYDDEKNDPQTIDTCSKCSHGCGYCLMLER